MMAAYQPTPGGGHPGMAHGHPAMVPTPGHQMAPQMQMHPGVSGAPHVSQPGAMMGMQPGGQGMAGGAMGGQHPGAMGMHAQMGGQSMPGGMQNPQGMSHMTPQQQMQQQMAHIQANPQLLAQQQQQMIRMRQQQMMAAQQNGMMGMQGGVPMNPAQLAQLQQQQHQPGMHPGGQGVQLPQHLLQQQMLLHQQQAQRAANQQHQQQNQMAHQLAMQHANSQQSNQGHPTPQNPQAANQPQQVRPQSRMANPNDQSQPPQQQTPQQGQAQPGQPQPQQTPQQQPQGTSQQPNAQQPQLTQQQRMAMLQRSQQIQAQRLAAQVQQSQAGQGGMFILRLMNFSDHLSNFNESNGNDMSAWHQFVERHFSPEGRLIHSFENGGPNGRSKTYEVLRATVARYFWTYFDSGASSLRLHTEHAREVPHQTGSHLVVCQHAIFTVIYPKGARLEMSGSLQVLFAAGSDAIDCIQFQTTGTEEILSRSQIERVISDWSPALPTKSPKMAKNKLPKAQQKMQEQQDRLTIDHFPKAPRGSMGITSKVQHFLEIGETMNLMSDLMHYAQEKKVRPEQAIEAMNAQYDIQQQNGGQSGNPQINIQANGVPQGARTPSMQSMQVTQNGQFSSPSVSNMSLPNGMNGSPHLGNNPGNLAPNMGISNAHTPSPHQSNMAAPPMMSQHSQQGTNSSAASANTSPNINNNNNNKRRRSTVKLEDGDGSGEGNPTGNNNRVKPSPRMPKKPKP